MSYRKKFIFLSLLFMGSFFSKNLCAQASVSAYQFSLKSVKGEKVELSPYRGKVVFLDFWASWCPPCKASIPFVSKLYEKYKGNKDFVIIGINMENISDAQKYISQKDIKYLNVIGDDITARNYQVRGIPTFILIDKRGNIVGRWVGFADSIYDEWTKSIDEALAEVIKEPKPKTPARRRRRR